MIVKGVLRYKGGPGSGNFGHAGRPGKVGGSAEGVALRISFYDINPEVPKIYEHRLATVEEQETFSKSINNIHPRIKSLWHGTDPVILVVDDTLRFAGKHQSNWIFLGYESLDGSIANHEFTHHIVQQFISDGTLTRYKPGLLFDHARDYDDIWTSLNEQLTMMLGCYNDDESVWVENVRTAETIHGYGMSEEDALENILRVRQFLGW